MDGKRSFTVAIESISCYFLVMIIKMFDSLTSYEQLLIKCSSVLGEYFPREMLLYIMASSTPRSTALGYLLFFFIKINSF